MSNDKEKREGMMQLLDNQYDWPAIYNFKFVVLATKINELKQLVGDEGLTMKMSSKGKYISLTINRTMNSSLEVVEFYEKVYVIEGIITL
ncbi:MAG: DUF493 family protein [Bacteriovoracaceae bacterium]|jgi:uncharacterized protein|nr:DUF493 family protein [Bacteriovoracaceae bacterium]